MALDLGLKGHVVTEATLNYIVTVQAEGGYVVQIGSAFILHTPDNELVISPAGDQVGAEFVAGLVGQTVTSALADETSGTLRLAFDNGVQIVVGPNDAYEAWTVAGPGGMKVVCMPGGELAVWSREA